MFNSGNPFRLRYRSGFHESLFVALRQAQGPTKELQQSLYPYCGLVLDDRCWMLVCSRLISILLKSMQSVVKK